ncbi:MAG: hypothetical protein LBU65_14280 [Planctomycetaceae bacterium]|nr:hypothetical protein [Planctomycetaceae bacterium]
MSNIEVVLTGIGIISPIGNDLGTYWDSLCNGVSGIRRLSSISTAYDELRPYGGEVGDFRAKELIMPRKNIKLMTRDIQMAVVAAVHACRDAGLQTADLDKTDFVRNVPPERIGVNFGADLIGAEVPALLDAFKAGITGDSYDFSTWGKGRETIAPLWMLKHLPNMPSCHITIANGAMGPSNTVMVCRGSCLASIFEGIRTIQRGIADVMICGAVGNRINPDFLSRGRSYSLAPDSYGNAVPRPFDTERCGSVLAEGAGVYVIESRKFAEARGVKIRAALDGFAATTEAQMHGEKPTGEAIRRAIRTAIERCSRTTPDEIGHVNADGLGTINDDRAEAEAINAELGGIPVTAVKGATGNSGAGSGAVELAAAVLALENKLLPPTCNHTVTAADCPVNVVHGKPLAVDKPAAIKLNQTYTGRSFALVIRRES